MKWKSMRSQVIKKVIKMFCIILNLKRKKNEGKIAMAEKMMYLHLCVQHLIVMNCENPQKRNATKRKWKINSRIHNVYRIMFRNRNRKCVRSANNCKYITLENICIISSRMKKEESNKRQRDGTFDEHEYRFICLSISGVHTFVHKPDHASKVERKNDERKEIGSIVKRYEFA